MDQIPIICALWYLRRFCSCLIRIYVNTVIYSEELFCFIYFFYGDIIPDYNLPCILFRGFWEVPWRGGIEVKVSEIIDVFLEVLKVFHLIFWGRKIWRVQACIAGVFFERAICSRKPHVETSRREEEMGRVKGSGEGAGSIFFLPSPSPLSFFRPRTYRKGYYFSPQSFTVIKSKMGVTTRLWTRTRFRPPKIRLHCRLGECFLVNALI